VGDHSVTHAQGRRSAAIGRELGVLRNTMRQAVRGEQPPKFARPPKPTPKLSVGVRSADPSLVVRGATYAGKLVWLLPSRRSHLLAQDAKRDVLADSRSELSACLSHGRQARFNSTLAFVVLCGRRPTACPRTRHTVEDCSATGT
jgi:hypothetical protein